jgi:hypothetical protein
VKKGNPSPEMEEDGGIASSPSLLIMTVIIGSEERHGPRSRVRDESRRRCRIFIISYAFNRVGDRLHVGLDLFIN